MLTCGKSNTAPPPELKRPLSVPPSRFNSSQQILGSPAEEPLAVMSHRPRKVSSAAGLAGTPNRHAASIVQIRSTVSLITTTFPLRSTEFLPSSGIGDSRRAEQILEPQSSSANPKRRIPNPLAGRHQATCHTVSSRVPSTHFTTATGRSPKVGFSGLPPQMRSTSCWISARGRMGKPEPRVASIRS